MAQPLSYEELIQENQTLRQRIFELETPTSQVQKDLKRYQVIMEKARDIILFVDLQGKILEANNTALQAYGYTRPELLSLSIFDLRKADPITKDQMNQAYSEGIIFETNHYCKDGRSFPVEVNSQGATIGGKKVLLSIIRDITERKRVEEELLKAKKAAEVANIAKSQFLANMSHEIRTPMNGIIGLTDLLLRDEVNDTQREFLGLIQESAHSLMQILNDILDLSKIESDCLELNCEDFDIKETIFNLSKTLEVAAHHKGIALLCSIDSAVPQWVGGDILRLKQIIINLVNNAIKFTEQGLVAINVSQINATNEKVTLKFKISDTGIGIAQDKLETIFERFSQADQSTTKKYGGTGLGLAIVKHLVKKMDGTIQVESQPQKGSTFILEIPFYKTNVLHCPITDDGNNLSGIPKRVRILVAEDNKTNQFTLQKMLERNRFEVTVVETGKEVLNQISKQKYDLILMDIQMPEMDGLESTAYIRELENGTNQHIPIIAFTALARADDKARCLTAGMDGYLSKPVKLEELYQMLAQFIKN